MADQEIAKHTKKIWSVVRADAHLWHKVREMLLEIFIIVFAVSMSIWLHTWAEHRHEQKQVRTFLLGLKSDIQNDIRQIEGVVAFHRDADEKYRYLAALDPNAAPDPEKFEAAYRLINANNFLIARLGRYEGFKSSGKMTNIEDEALLEKIVDLYQYDIPKASLSSGGWRSLHGKLTDYLEAKTADDDSLASRYKAVTSRTGKLLAARTVTFPQLYERHQTLLDGGNAIIKAIDAAYPAER
jgi:hypothetical protein